MYTIYTHRCIYSMYIGVYIVYSIFYIVYMYSIYSTCIVYVQYLVYIVYSIFNIFYICMHIHTCIHIYVHILGCNKCQENKASMNTLLSVLPNLAHCTLITPKILRFLPHGMCEGVVSEKSIFLVNFLPMCQLNYHLKQTYY